MIMGLEPPRQMNALDALCVSALVLPLTLGSYMVAQPLAKVFFKLMLREVLQNK